VLILYFINSDVNDEKSHRVLGVACSFLALRMACQMMEAGAGG
jgi:hypothetical protein